MFRELESEQEDPSDNTQEVTTSIVGRDIHRLSEVLVSFLTNSRKAESSATTGRFQFSQSLNSPSFNRSTPVTYCQLC
jgi:hypothetical protein